jgi:hypothetical protein
MALTIVWRNRLPLIRTERTLQRIISNEFGAVYAVTAPDFMTEIDATVLLVEHGLVLDTTDLAPISSGEPSYRSYQLKPTAWSPPFFHLVRLKPAAYVGGN